MKRIISTFMLMLFAVSISFGQSGVNINNTDYKFKFSLPSDWKERQFEETAKKDAISYSFDRNDGKVSIMLLAFKVDEVKNLNDFVYTLEKDLTLNIPKKDGSYEEFDQGVYDGKTAKYKDSEFTEIIYFYRSKINEGANFTYLLRFIALSSSFHSETEKSIIDLAKGFTPVLVD